MAVYVKVSELDVPEARKALVDRWQCEIIAAKKHFESDFLRIRQDMDLVRRGAPREWEDLENYIVNVLQRFVRSKTATLYAKNPVSIHKRKPRMDFVIWDGKPSSMQEAQQALAMFQEAQMANADMGGTLGGGGPIAPPEAVQEAMALLADIESGMARRDLIDRVGKTLTLLHKHYIDEQQPRYKGRMKGMVRQAIATGVSYVKLGFHREMGKSPTTQQQIADTERRLSHMRRLAAEQAEGESTPTEADAAELLQMLDSLMAAEDIVLREGLTYDFPSACAIIPDPACTCLKGFVGADWVAEEFFYTPEEVKELFSVDVGDQYNGHAPDRTSRPAHEPNDNTRTHQDNEGLVCVWEVYHMSSGLRYVVGDGIPDFLEEPAPPSVQLERFWPWFVYSYNELPHEKAIFPYSDVYYMKHSQFEINRSREAMNQHRMANRPKYATPDGTLDDEDKDSLQNADGNTIITLRGLAAGQSVDAVLQPIAQTGVDPNLYVTNPYFEDIQMSVGAQEATFGAVSGSTATESSIAEAARTASTESEGDELNDLLSDLAREAGQILLTHVAQDRVKQIVGPGAVWPEIQLDDMRDEIYLDVVAGSNGRPNRAHRAQTLQMVAPIMLQVPGFKPDWLAQQLVTVLDEGLDFESAFASGMPSMQAMNQAAASMFRGQQGMSPEANVGAATAFAGQDPSLQGMAGMSPAPLTQSPGGTPGMPGTPMSPQVVDLAA